MKLKIGLLRVAQNFQYDLILQKNVICKTFNQHFLIYRKLFKISTKDEQLYSISLSLVTPHFEFDYKQGQTVVHKNVS